MFVAEKVLLLLVISLTVHRLSYQFSIIGITEAWLKTIKTHFMGLMVILSYKTAKSGGEGVLCIKNNNLQFTFLHDMSIPNGTIESVLTEIEGHILNSKKNVINGVVYDYNINILKYIKHSSTGNFPDLMYSISFIPSITRLTRSISSIIIYNIYTNNIDDLMSTTHGI